MSDYSQPEFYRFNEDSLRLVKWVEEKQLRPSAILDLGAGCGVIGIELSNRLHPKILTLVEAQIDYKPHLEENVRSMLTSGAQTVIALTTFSHWIPSCKYDLIVCNPPYFLAGNGVVSKDQRKHIARTFVLDGWEVLTDVILKSLAPGGKAFIVIRREQKLDEKLLKGYKLSEKDHLKFLELS